MLPIWLITLQGGNSVFGSPLFLMLIIFAVFYFIVIRPARRSQQETETMRDRLKNGDHVLTSSGMYGTIVGVSEEIIQLRVADSVKIQFSKSAIAQLVEEPVKKN